MLDRSDTDARLHRQLIVQEVNRRVEDLSSRWQPDAAFLLLLCECGLSGCTERVEVPRATFDSVRMRSAGFVMRPGHEWDADVILERRDGYIVAHPDGSE